MHARTVLPWRWLGPIATLSLLVLGPHPLQAAPPPAAVPVGPTGIITGTTHAFTWQGAPDATYYYLQVNDQAASPRFTLWYPAAQACPGGSATCTVVLSTGFAVGPGIWWVQTWSAEGFGPWSTGMPFTVSYVPGAWSQNFSLADERFQLVMGGAMVLDKETGLVWERTPPATTNTWGASVRTCLNQTAPNRKGWRLPALEELSSLVQPGQTNPSLVGGHPFTILNVTYWSATTDPENPANALVVHFGAGIVSSAAKSTSVHRWCVRGGHGAPGVE
jgi:hypothetical protein